MTSSKQLSKNCEPAEEEEDEDDDDEYDYKRPSLYPRTCEKCNIVYSTRSSFSRHKKICGHDKRRKFSTDTNGQRYSKGSSSTNNKSCDGVSLYISCPHSDCTAKFKHCFSMWNHIEAHHDQNINQEEYTFKNMAEFLIWKKSHVQKNCVSMVRYSGVVEGSGHKTYYYVCKFNNKKKRSRRKKCGSVPHADCSARMRVKETKAGVHVKYFNTHNHDLNVKNLQFDKLDNSTKLQIHYLLQYGIPARTIQKYFQTSDDNIDLIRPIKERFLTVTEIHKMKNNLKKKKSTSNCKEAESDNFVDDPSEESHSFHEGNNNLSKSACDKLNQFDSDKKTDALLPALHNSFTPNSFTEPINNVKDIFTCYFKVGPFTVSDLHLKSLDSNISDAEIFILSSVDSDFRNGRLYDNIISAFLFKISCIDPGVCLIDPAISKLVVKEETLNEVLVSLKSFNFSNFSKLLIPLNPFGNQWILLVANAIKKQLLFYDPVSIPLKGIYLDLVIRWVEVLSDKLNDTVSEWKVIVPNHVLQQDNVSCGVFVCWFAERILLEKTTNQSFDLHNYRRYIYNVITTHETL